MAENFVIVIDPGHGGSNEGLNYDGFLEKDMNLVTAKAMQELLQQYDNTEVYITNPDKKDMSLKERAEYAKVWRQMLWSASILICPKIIRCTDQRCGFPAQGWQMPKCMHWEISSCPSFRSMV